jgi:hypothetical protein
MPTETPTQTDQTDNLATYTPPAIMHELTLETRAGSPLGIDPLIDPLGVDPTTK